MVTIVQVASMENDEVLEEGAYICTWCGKGWPTKSELNRHWLRTPECNRNKGVNNPTQSKYNVEEDD